MSNFMRLAIGLLCIRVAARHPQTVLDYVLGGFCLLAAAIWIDEYITAIQERKDKK